MEFSILVLNFVYALAGVAVTIVAMAVGYKVFDGLTPFNAHDELAKGNVAVGIVVGSILIGLGISIGLVIGMGLN